MDFWIIPIIQGFVQIEELVVNYNEASDEEKSSPETPPQESLCVDDIYPCFLVALISRRSRHRAGKPIQSKCFRNPRGSGNFLGEKMRHLIFLIEKLLVTQEDV